MTTGQLIVVAVAIFIAAFVQMLAGFGFALLAMPVMTLAIPVEEAVVIVSILGLATTGVAVDPPSPRRRSAAGSRLIVASFVGMPLGLVILNVVDDTALKIVLGISVLIATALLVRRLNLVARRPGTRRRVRVHVRRAQHLARHERSAARVRPPGARPIDADTFRATISTVFVFGNMLALTLFVVDGKVTERRRCARRCIAAPAWLLGQALGWPTRRHVHGERFRWLVLTLLFAAGVTAIVFAVTSPSRYGRRRCHPTTPERSGRVGALRAICECAAGRDASGSSHGELAWFAGTGKQRAPVRDHVGSPSRRPQRGGDGGARRARRSDSSPTIRRATSVRRTSGSRGWIGIYLDTGEVDWDLIELHLRDAHATIAGAPG